MYQCVESKREREEKTGNGNDVRKITTWEYRLEWRSDRVDSSHFKGLENNEAWQALSRGCGRDFKSNPTFTMQSQTLSASSLYAGDYDLSRHLSKISANEPMHIRQGRYVSPSSEASWESPSSRRIAKDGSSYTR